MEGICPICDSKFKFEELPVLNELVICPECGGELEVIQVAPPILVEAPEEEEDWGE